MLEDLRNHISKLIALYEGEKQRADALAVSLEESHKAEQGYKEQIAELNRQIDNQRLTSAFMAGTSEADAKARLTKLIGEIDKCIKLLEKA